MGECRAERSGKGVLLFHRRRKWLRMKWKTKRSDDYAVSRIFDGLV